MFFSRTTSTPKEEDYENQRDQPLTSTSNSTVISQSTRIISLEELLLAAHKIATPYILCERSCMKFLDSHSIPYDSKKIEENIARANEMQDKIADYESRKQSAPQMNSEDLKFIRDQFLAILNNFKKLADNIPVWVQCYTLPKDIEKYLTEVQNTVAKMARGELQEQVEEVWDGVYDPTKDADIDAEIKKDSGSKDYLAAYVGHEKFKKLISRACDVIKRITPDNRAEDKDSQPKILRPEDPKTQCIRKSFTLAMRIINHPTVQKNKKQDVAISELLEQAEAIVGVVTPFVVLDPSGKKAKPEKTNKLKSEIDEIKKSERLSTLVSNARGYARNLETSGTLRKSGEHLSENAEEMKIILENLLKIFDALKDGSPLQKRLGFKKFESNQSVFAKSWLLEIYRENNRTKQSGLTSEELRARLFSGYKPK